MCRVVQDQGRQCGGNEELAEKDGGDRDAQSAIPMMTESM